MASGEQLVESAKMAYCDTMAKKKRSRSTGPMTANQYRHALDVLGISQLGAGKPFKVGAFSKGNEASVSDWEGGALESLMGGCKVGVSMRADPKAAPQAIEQAAATELASTDAALKAIKPVVAEIIIGY